MNLVGVEFSSKLAFEIETTSLEINFKPSLVSLYFGRFIFGHEDDRRHVWKYKSALTVLFPVE